MENCIGKTGLITDKKSLFKGQNCTVVKEQKRWYVCEVEDNGKPKNVYVSKGGIKFEGERKPKFKVNDMVYSWQNEDYKARVSHISDQGVTEGVDYGFHYKVSLRDKEGYSHSSKWMGEDSLSKTKKESYAKGGNLEKGNWEVRDTHTGLMLRVCKTHKEARQTVDEILDNPQIWGEIESLSIVKKGSKQFEKGGNVGDNYSVKENQYIPRGSNKGVSYYYVENSEGKTINKNTGKIYRGKEMSNYKFETKESAQKYADKLNGVQMAKGGNINAKTKAKLLIINSANPLSKQLIAEGFEQFNAIDYSEVKHANFNILTHNDSKKTFVVYPERIYSQLDEDALQADVEFLKKQGVELVESFEQGGNIPNNYEGKTAEQVWDSWDAKQRYHFLSDHAAFIEQMKGVEEIESSELRKTRNADWKKLEKVIKLLISNHVSEGQYADGGNVESEVYIEYLNKKKNFKKDIKNFNSYEEAVAWARKNLGKFHPDMIKYRFADGGNIEVDGHKLVYERWSKASGGDGTTGTIRTVPQNYYVATVHENGVITFDKMEANTKNINEKEVEKLWNENKIPRKPSKGWDNSDNANKYSGGDFVSEGKDKNGKTAIVYYNNDSKKYHFTVDKSGIHFDKGEFETKDEAIQHLIGKGFEMQFYSDKRSALQIEREIKELENEMEKNKKDYETAVARIEKIKGDKLVELSEIKSVSSEAAKPQQGWLVGLSEEQIEFLCGLINRYGTMSEHPKATKENLGSFKYEYLKNLILSVSQDEIEEDGMSVLNGLKAHFNI